MNIDIRVDVREVERMLGRVGEEIVPKAAATAINNLAFDARTAVQNHMRAVFDRPTPYALSLPYVQRARPNRLTAEIGARDKVPGFFDPQTRGGSRAAKRMEHHLRARGLIGDGEYLVPSKFQPLDAYGNVPRGVLQKILANLQAHHDPYQRTPTGGARGGKKKGEYFFTRAGVRGQRLTAIWRRTPAGNAVPAFIVTRAPKYRRRLAFEATVNRTVIEKWPREFERAISYEISKL